MSSEPLSLDDSFVPPEPLHPKSSAFHAQIASFLDGQPKDPALVESSLAGWDDLFSSLASDLYRIGSMLLGEGEDAVALIEKMVTTLDIRATHDAAEARHNGRLALAAQAIEILRYRADSSLAAPVDDGSAPASCIEDDDLESAGLTQVEFEQMLSGPDSQHLRQWLEGLAVPLRVVFVLRAVAGLSSTEIAVLLAEHGGPAAEDWTPDAVRSAFRQALCSLASQLIHSSAAK